MEKVSPPFPMTRRELHSLGWNQCDYIIVTGDAFVDHPSFGTAIIARVLESLGNKIGFISQPSWQGSDDFTVLGRPKKAFLVTAGAIDSMVAHYTASLKPRKDDAFSPGGAPGLRPNRAVITYTARIRQAYKGILVIAGGLEASLRRISHYDCWSDTVRRSVLLDAKLDAIIYGMGERQITQIDQTITSGGDFNEIQKISGIVFSSHRNKYQSLPGIAEVFLPDYQHVADRDLKSNAPTSKAKKTFAESVHLRLVHENPMKPCRIIEPCGDILVVQNPPALPLERDEMDRVYSLPYTRRAFPGNEIPALKEVLFSITSSRGCYGSCTFCSLRAHQGRIIQERSSESIVGEARKLTEDPRFKGNIHDVGGPTANFRSPPCSRQLTPGKGPCERRECLYPDQCASVGDDHEEYLQILTQLRKLPGIKKVFVRSGIRYDHLLQAPELVRERFMQEFCAHHVSGQLKVAPEHVSRQVLDAMGKPGIELFEQFSRQFRDTNKKLQKKQYLIPYLISAHPGSGLTEAVELAEYLRAHGFIPDQVQDFYPTPGTVASCMYFSGLDPRPGKQFASIYIPKGRERSLQRALLHHHKPENRKLVLEALSKAGRMDIAGYLTSSKGFSDRTRK